MNQMASDEAATRRVRASSIVAVLEPLMTHSTSSRPGALKLMLSQ